jgi:mannan endo-1,4-beta-mannosidase
LQWIKDHAECRSSRAQSSDGIAYLKLFFIAAKKANKPVILEEFGVMGLRSSISLHGRVVELTRRLALENKTEIYPKWVQTALDTDHS